MDLSPSHPILARFLSQTPWQVAGGGSLQNELTFRFGRAITEPGFLGGSSTRGEYELELVAPEWTLTPTGGGDTIRWDDEGQRRRAAIRGIDATGELRDVALVRQPDRFRIELTFEQWVVTACSHSQASWLAEHADDDEDELEEDEWQDLPSNTSVLQLSTPDGIFEIYHDGTHTPTDRLLDPDTPIGELPTDRERIWPDFDPFSSPRGA